MMTEFERDRLHVLRRNPNYRGEPYPCDGMPEDAAAGLLVDCGKTMPFIDTLFVTIEKEKVARKEKFKQGYLDVPEIERPEWGVDFRNDADDSGSRDCTGSACPATEADPGERVAEPPTAGAVDPVTVMFDNTTLPVLVMTQSGVIVHDGLATNAACAAHGIMSSSATG